MNEYDTNSLRMLLDSHAGARTYYEELPPLLRAVLRTQTDIASFAEMQSFLADERESGVARGNQ